MPNEFEQGVLEVIKNLHESQKLLQAQIQLVDEKVNLIKEELDRRTKCGTLQ